MTFEGHIGGEGHASVMNDMQLYDSLVTSNGLSYCRVAAIVR